MEDIAEKNPIDVYVGGGGTVYVLRPATDVGKAWLRENCQTEEWNWLGENLAVEHRYVGDIVNGMIADGLLVA